MPIAGSVVLASEAIPASSSPAPYKIYTVINPTGVQMYGFTLVNTANIPVNYTIFQDSMNNTIASGTITALATVVIPLQGYLLLGETILAVANFGGVVQLEVDGLINVVDPNNQLLMGLMLMMNQAFGVDLPSQAMLNLGAVNLT